MSRRRLFLCENEVIQGAQPTDIEVTELRSFGTDRNVFIGLDNVTDAIQRSIAPRLKDLLLIGAYVYTADCAVARGTKWTDDNSTESWGRELHFRIPVRDYGFWSTSEVKACLTRALNFLSDDQYFFEFLPIKADSQEQFQLGMVDKNKWPFSGTDSVVMFSGGLDSLAGAVEMASRGENIVLVSHRSVSHMNSRQKKLVKKLNGIFPSRVIHIPVWVYKEDRFNREYTQRTRSFLYSTIALMVANAFNSRAIRFFENGVVSLNLPIADEVLRARGSRTTHPRSLDLLSQFHRLVIERDIEIENPFINKTKMEVIEVIAKAGAAELIPSTCSCSHGFFKSKDQQHCGTCSQCIDRRIAIIAAGQEENDPWTDYVSDVFTGKRKEGQEMNMAVNFARHALELSTMSEEEIGTRFSNELSRAVRNSENRSEAALELIQMHQRHGDAVMRVLERKLTEHVGDLTKGLLEATCMLSMIAGQNHLRSSWERYSERICDVLSKGLPVVCQTYKPENERHLQEICDGLLTAEDPKLVREFPFMRWSSSLTKPDWSSENHNLLIEAKYLKAETRPGRITDEVASDITKYGDNGRSVLFIVYDPFRRILDEETFSEPVRRRVGMFVEFVR